MLTLYSVIISINLVILVFDKLHWSTMFPLFATAFLVIPVLEIYLLIRVGQVIGAGWTVVLVVLTAIIGVWLLRLQGLSTLARAQDKLRQNELPANEILEGMGLLVAGALLLTPGFFTDAIGFLLLLPPTRRWIVSRFAARMVVATSVRMHDETHRRNDVIDGVNYRRED